jgi:antitoxin ParD1/3/4/toxin ParE1/3/4
MQGGVRSSKLITLEMQSAFGLLALNPRLGHPRTDLAGDRNLLFWPVRDYLVIYVPSTRPLSIAMIVRGNRDVALLIENRF